MSGYNATVYVRTPRGIVSSEAVYAERSDSALGFRVLRSSGVRNHLSGTPAFHDVRMADPHMPEDGWREIEWDGGEGALFLLLGVDPTGVRHG